MFEVFRGEKLVTTFCFTMVSCMRCLFDAVDKKGENPLKREMFGCFFKFRWVSW